MGIEGITKKDRVVLLVRQRQEGRRNPCAVFSSSGDSATDQSAKAGMLNSENRNGNRAFRSEIITSMNWLYQTDIIL